MYLSPNSPIETDMLRIPQAPPPQFLYSFVSGQHHNFVWMINPCMLAKSAE